MVALIGKIDFRMEIESKLDPANKVYGIWPIIAWSWALYNGKLETKKKDARRDTRQREEKGCSNLILHGWFYLFCYSQFKYI